MISEETTAIKNVFDKLGRTTKLEVLNRSNLNDVEIDLLTKRYINGLSLQECSDCMGLEINTISKKQHRAVSKLYNFLSKSNYYQNLIIN